MFEILFAKLGSGNTVRPVVSTLYIAIFGPESLRRCGTCRQNRVGQGRASRQLQLCLVAKNRNACAVLAVRRDFATKELGATMSSTGGSVQRVVHAVFPHLSLCPGICGSSVGSSSRNKESLNQHQL